MPIGEFELIARYLARPVGKQSGVQLGIGDDAAILDVRPDRKLVVAIDTIVEGVHFPANTTPADIGYRALAVNLSDLAAMGAEPAWFTLSLSLPQSEESWLEQFASGLFKLADAYDMELVGGDTVKGPLVITVQVAGWVEADRWLTRTGAKVGDAIVVSGVPGEAAGGLAALSREMASTESVEWLRERFLKPTPRISLGRAIRTFATSAMDISDGLLTDLDKLCAGAYVGASVDIDWLPVSAALHDTFAAEECLDFTLAGGDDYELLFTVSPADLPRLANLPTPCAVIGEITAEQAVVCRKSNEIVEVKRRGYDHFREADR